MTSPVAPALLPSVAVTSPITGHRKHPARAMMRMLKSDGARHLYYRYENNTYAPMLGGARIYYYTKSEDVKPFPPGLRMISGLAMTRNASDTKSLGLLISCDHGLQTQYLPNATSHPGGCSAIAMGITFPSCGLASGNLTSDDFL